MLDHLFDIDGNAKTEFERIDFTAQELRINGEVIWWRRFGRRDDDDTLRLF